MNNRDKQNILREKLKQAQTVDEKINQLTPEQREQIGEFRLSIIREGLKEFPGLDPMEALQMLDEFKFTLPTSYIPVSIVFVLYIISIILKFYRTTGLQRRILDFVGVVFFMLTSYFFSMNQDLSGSEFHYLSLILVYFISQIFVKKIKSSYVNFIFIVLIA